MTTAQEILEMIESVDPSDENVLLGIDARVWAYLNLQGDFRISFSSGGATHYRHNSWPATAQTILRHSFSNPKVTTSRDALKRIRPKLFSFDINTIDEHVGVIVRSVSFYKGAGFESPILPTEELAELHAIVQAIEHERKQKAWDNSPRPEFGIINEQKKAPE